MGIEEKPMWGKQPNHAIELTYIMAINKPKKVAHHVATTVMVPPYYPSLGV